MQKPKMKALDTTLWTIVVLLTGSVFFVNYYFHFSSAIMAFFWIGWICLTLLCGYYTLQGKRVISFAKEAKIELQKVVWPTRQETVQTTSIVMVMVAIAGLVLWGIDSGMMIIIGKLTNLG